MLHNLLLDFQKKLDEYDSDDSYDFEIAWDKIMEQLSELELEDLRDWLMALDDMVEIPDDVVSEKVNQVLSFFVSNKAKFQQLRIVETVRTYIANEVWGRQ